MTETSLFWTCLISGITFGFAAGVQPGPLMMYMISRTLDSGWRKAIPAIFAPLVSDGPIAVLCLAVLGSLPMFYIQLLRIPGGLFLLYLAFRAALAWRRRGDRSVPRESSSGQSLLDASLVNLLNPGPWLGWSLVIGPLFIEGWTVSPVNGLATLAGFYMTMFIISGLVIALCHGARQYLPGIRHWLLGVSVIFLAGFGFWQLVTGIVEFFATR